MPSWVQDACDRGKTGSVVLDFICRVWWHRSHSPRIGGSRIGQQHYESTVRRDECCPSEAEQLTPGSFVPCPRLASWHRECHPSRHARRAHGRATAPWGSSVLWHDLNPPFGGRIRTGKLDFLAVLYMCLTQSPYRVPRVVPRVIGTRPVVRATCLFPQGNQPASRQH